MRITPLQMVDNIYIPKIKLSYCTNQKEDNLSTNDNIYLHKITLSYCVLILINLQKRITSLF